MCVCVCVCMCEREREGLGGGGHSVCVVLYSCVKVEFHRPIIPPPLSPVLLCPCRIGDLCHVVVGASLFLPVHDSRLVTQCL